MILDINDILQIMSSALSENNCIYLSTPITGGLYRVANPEDIDGTIAHNALRSKLYKYLLINYDYHDIIDPGATYIHSFTQDQYLELWKSIIKKFAGVRLLMPDFNYSEGCVVEASFAISRNIPIYHIPDENSILGWKRLSSKDLMQLIYEAIPTMKLAGLSTESHERVAEVLSLGN
jgi:hypothetical protein